MQSADDACVIPKSPSYGWGRDNSYGKYYGWGGMAMSRSMENLMTGLGGQAFPAGYTVDNQGMALSTDAESSTFDPNANRFRLGVPATVDPRGPVLFEPTSVASGGVESDLIDGDAVANVSAVSLVGVYSCKEHRSRARVIAAAIAKRLRVMLA